MSMTNEDRVDYFLLNEEFRKWVMEPDEYRNAFWYQWQDNHPEDVDAMKKARVLIDNLQYPEICLGEEVKKKIFSEVIRKTEIGTANFRKELLELERRNSYYQNWYRIAAVISFICIYSALSVFFTHTERPQITELTRHIIESPIGKRAVYAMPDGSNIMLNAGSKIIFDEQFGKDHRRLELHGEAFFSVVQNIQLPFIVKAKDTYTEALGTSFNIRAFEFDDNVKVALQSGSVSVDKTRDWSQSDGVGVENATFLLIPGEALKIPDKGEKPEKYIFRQEIEFAWKTGVLVLQNSTFNDMLRALENWYGVVISFKGSYPANLKINGRFDNETLEQVLQGLSFTHGLQFSIKGKNVELKI
jgi:transmembrane sensor